MNVLLLFLVGLAAGWMAERVTDAPTGRLASIAIGLAGALLGSFLLGLAGPAARGLFGSLVTATGGALALLFVVGLLQRKP